MKFFIPFIIYLLCIPPSLNAQNWKEIAQKLPEKAIHWTPNSLYGKSIDIDGNYAVVGAANYVTILYYNGSNWIEQAELNASDSRINFGVSVSISGNVIVVGSAGKAYVFEKPITGWVDMTENAILSATNSTASTIGFSVSVSGNNVIVGNYSYNNDIGCAYMYTKPTGGWSNMTETAILTPTNGVINDYFGFSVALSGDVAVIGMPGKRTIVSPQTTGKAMIFTKPSTGWNTTGGTVLLNASNGMPRDHLGFSVNISGDYIVLGAPYASTYGQAYVYKKAIGGWNSSNETAILQQRTRPVDTIPTNTILFGQSVSIHGDNIVVGGYDSFADYNVVGFAYTFAKPNLGWQDTTETARLTTTGNKTFNYFGAAVGIHGDHILVGANKYGLEELGISDLGAVYTYEAPTTGWVDTTETALKISPVRLHALENRFGTAVDIDGDYAVVSSTGYSNNFGQVSVYYYDGSNWVLQAYLLTSDSSTTTSFGTAVSISGDYIVVGVPQSKSNNIAQGAVYLYKKPTGGWINTTETAKLIASDGATGDFFGISVRISGDEVVVGAHRDSDLGYFSGSAYVFTKPTTGWANGTETAKLLASDGAARNNFGTAVDIEGNYIVVGAPNTSGFGSIVDTGAAYIFEKPSNGWLNMTETAKLSPSDGIPNGNFGSSIAISGNDIVVGAYKDNENGFNAGAAYLFTKPISGTWSNTLEDAKLTASDGVANYYFGSSVAISGKQVIVGSPYTNDLGAESGSVYTFVKPNTGWVSTTENTKTLATNGLTKDAFGGALAISEDYMLIGAPFKDEVDFRAGAAYFFKSCPIIVIDTTIAQGNSVIVGNNTYNTSGTYRDTFPTQDCDSIVVTNLTVGLNIQQTLDEYNTSLFLYPNPSTGSLTVELSDDTHQAIIEIEIFDRLGKLVYYRKNQSKELDLMALPKGLYFLRVNQKHSQSFILSTP